MLLSMIRDMDSVATKILVTLNVDLQEMKDDILEVVGINPKEYEESYENGHSAGGALEQFATDLTAKAE